MSFLLLSLSPSPVAFSSPIPLPPLPVCNREHFRLQQARQLPDTVVVASRPQIPRAEDVK